jgi:alkylhydroperoxidase family enzyme
VNWLTGTDRDGTLALLPDIADHLQSLYRSFFTLQCLPPQTVELCRLRLARLHRSVTDWQLEEVPVSPERRSALRQWHESGHFDAAERACLALAEVYAIDAAAITDEQADAVKHHYGDAGLVALVEALGIFDGRIRLGLLWGSSVPTGEATA